MNVNVRLAALVATVALLLAVPAMADQVQVFVGYADSLRPSGFFPSPWAGDPNVVFTGQTSADTSDIDSGAIRIDNTGADSITISNLKATLNGGATVYALWGPVTLAPGQKGIFDQTNGENFDSSDNSGNGIPFDPALYPNNFGGNGNTSQIGGCSSSPAQIALAPGAQAICDANIPVISFTLTDNVTSVVTPESFLDTGHIIDTGYWDFVNNSIFGEDGNESIQWNTIGSVPNRGGDVPEPSSVILFGTGLAATFAALRRKVSKQQ